MRVFIEKSSFGFMSKKKAIRQSKFVVNEEKFYNENKPLAKASITSRDGELHGVKPCSKNRNSKGLLECWKTLNTQL
jgi:hypothetical protein